MCMMSPTQAGLGWRCNRHLHGGISPGARADGFCRAPQPAAGRHSSADLAGVVGRAEASAPTPSELPPADAGVLQRALSDPFCHLAFRCHRSAQAFKGWWTYLCLAAPSAAMIVVEWSTFEVTPDPALSRRARDCQSQVCECHAVLILAFV